MNRSALGSLILIVWLTVYVVGAVLLWEILPLNKVFERIYFAVAGFAWLLPLPPLLRWMQQGKSQQADAWRP